jgi:dethiobiotin synthetase
VSILFVTGTGTGVGKTVATAALATCAPGSVAVVKLAQTGVAPLEPGDLAEVTRLSGCTDVHELARYPEPLSPYRAAWCAGAPEWDVGTAVLRIADLANSHDLVLVEGAGGLLVPYNGDGQTIVDVASELDAPLMLVSAAGLGTINHTPLTVSYLAEQAVLELAGIIIGSWPKQPDLADRFNVGDLARMARGSQLSGVLPADMAAMGDFSAVASASLGPQCGGTFDFRAFWDEVRPQR